jgi:hypothetical protein
MFISICRAGAQSASAHNGGKYMREIIYQQHLSPGLRVIVGNADYRERQRILKRVDKMLTITGLEKRYVEESLRRPEVGDNLSARRQQSIIKHAIRALRCTLVRMLLSEDLRGLAVSLAESSLLQWFCRIDELDVVKVPSKSTLQRYENMVTAPDLKELNNILVRCVAGGTGAQDVGLEHEADLDRFFIDSTCLPANIHFPVDWTLMRDGAGTLLAAIIIIRKHGLRHRIMEPAMLMRRMNLLCMEMTFARRRKDSCKARKMILRKLKKLAKIIRKHGERYYELLDARWPETDWTRREAEQVLKRMRNVLDQLPEAMRQAHERIIGGRPVANEKKILSLYESDIHVIVRGKANAEVEFGNTLMLCEQSQGLIVDYKLYQGQAPADARLLPACARQLQKDFAGILPHGAFKISMAGDRGYDSGDNQNRLADMKWFNAVAARNPLQLKRQRKKARFVKEQTRRAQTEGRIGIVKINFIGDPVPTKGFDGRSLRVAWAVLAHNLWVIARLPEKQAKEKAA